MAKQNSGNIRQYRKPLNINPGMIIFSVIFVYIVICIFIYFNQKHVVGYEVKAGSLSVNTVYQGLALRDETIISSDSAGYINYYAREGERVGAGNLVCTLDESGKLKDLLDEQVSDGSSLTANDLNELRSQISGFSSNFHPESFDSVYDFKYGLQGTALKLANINVLENLASMNNGENVLVDLCHSPVSGILVYSTDGFESVTPEQVTAEMFDTSNYEKHQLINNELVAAGDPVYKLSTNENWSIIIQEEPERAAQLLEEDYVKVRFLQNQYTSWGKVSVLNNDDGNTYVKLDFNNSMVTFSNDRYIEIELVLNNENGLKVPNSAIAEKEFFIVPKDYVTKGGNSGEMGVLKQIPGENGTIAHQFVATTIYHETDAEYYLDNSTLEIGDYILRPDSNETYMLSQSAALQGVYNINKGYADFKEIQILGSNEEYSIIKSNTQYGLSAYDHIVLDASSVDLDELLY